MENLSIEPAAGSSLIEVALHKMKRAIVCCELTPGTKLKVEALSKAYGLSSSPIREALNRLAQEGIVTASDNKGFRVAPISVEDFREISRIRRLLECEALSDAMTYGDDEWEGEILAAFHRLSMVEKRLGKGPVALDDDWSVRHKAFHFAMFRACPSPLLLGMVDSLFDRAERYRRFSALHRQSGRHKHNEHQMLLDAVLARDKDKALTQLSDHIGHTETSISEAIERQLATLQ
ncbi:GntR family transcriptional regulator [Duganella sp. BJB488]|uniref:GntR family transcriptional regulator n=1 Tax=unclassified Duganella TaxID=2636909 RepID=UPI000E349EB1|nr:MULTISPECIES: GntR family transcriptional regulator [unclassified Duganella]RFP09280.1 GntR family transcriptional regulator [Duganella sp. BJB475]RFP13169.1 GntR family transcriptional regulator [Duganella sp. BJB489]RFP17068.1 GntR family transcriptional regulator [Duganella sp. BJB488]RFP25315.1 GntR family transcriptional regulator [Duganella sp. BJB476]RFP31523.1 GntR family transcriptional regulator [Duganella sp. BJB480]